MTEKNFLQYIEDTDNIELMSFPANKNNRYGTSILHSFKCKLKVGDRSIDVCLTIPKMFPLEVPRFYLNSYDELGFLPHIEPNGFICFLESESCYINTDVPDLIFKKSVERAIQTLQNGLDGSNIEDFREEFQVFWERNKFVSKLEVFTFFDLEETPKKIQLVKNDIKAFVFNKGINVDYAKRKFFKGSKSFVKSGVYIPLMEECEIIPPKYTDNWDSDAFSSWIKPLVSKENKDILDNEVLAKDVRKMQYVLLGIPRKNGTKLIVGVQLIPKNGTNHPLACDNSNWSYTPLKVRRRDKKSILPRGGARLKLTTKKILVIGCGSVGSHLINNLVKIGADNLTLVDYDRIEIENIQRHFLGYQNVGKFKTEALKEDLSKNHFWTNIQVKNGKIEYLIEKGELNLSDYDLVISATGDPTINLYLNNATKSNDLSLIIGWNEPYGIGGHALLSFSNKAGCYKCLFDEEGYNRASFAGKDQPKVFHKKHLGCGEVFTPYNALDSIRTAEMIARLALEVLEEKLKDSTLLSWKGDDEDFINEGFNLSNRYLRQKNDCINLPSVRFAKSGCQHCAHS